MNFRIILFFVICVSCARCAKILVIAITDMNSHFTAVSGLIEHLSPFHDITLYVDSSLNYEPLPNVTLVSVKTASFAETMRGNSFRSNSCYIDLYDLVRNYLLYTNEAHYGAVLKSSGISQLFNRKEKFDLMIINGYLSEQFHFLAHALDVPLVQITPSILLPWHHDVINNPYSLADDFEFVGTDSRTSFSARLYKFVKAALITYYYNNYYLETINRAVSKFYPPGTPPFNEVNKRTDLVFVNTHKMMGYARAYVPTVVEVGGLHIKPPKSLPSDIEQFISGAGEHGFIYFSLGTFVSGTIITKNIQKSILNVFGRMPQRVLWKWNKQISDAPSNVKFSKWLPQADILAHENIKLSISHGGMLSVQEALYHGVPLLILPILYDQNTNAFLAEKKDFGKSLSFCHFKEDLFENYVKTLVNNATLRQKVKQISRGIKHQNRDLRERINWWIDFIDNYRGTKILEPVLPYQKWFDVSYDLFLFFLFILIVTMYLIFYLCSISMKNVIIIRSARRKKNE